MYLADTSIWIDIFNNNSTKNIKELFESQQITLTPEIYFEILQGCKNFSLFNKLKQILLEQTFYHLKDDKKSYEEAALIYCKCRKKGITIHSTIACLVAQCAIEHDLILLHNDKDFVRMAGVIPTLQQEYTGD